MTMAKKKRLKQKKRKRTKWKRSGKMIKHHIQNRCMGGSSKPHNLLLFDSEREKAWHFIFRNLSFYEAGTKLLNWKLELTEEETKAWYFLFKNKTEEEVARLLLRVDRMKKERGK